MNAETKADRAALPDVWFDMGPLSLCRDALENYPGGMLVIDASDRPLLVGPHSDSLMAAMERAAINDLRLAGALPSSHDGLPRPLPAPVRDLAARARAEGAVEETVTLPGETGPAWFSLSLLPLDALGHGGAIGCLLLLARDVTLERTLRTALVDSRQRYKDFVEISTDFAWETGSDGAFAFVSPRGALGYTAQRLLAMDPAALVADYFGPGECPFHVREPLEGADIWLRSATGDLVCVRMSAAPLFNAAGEWIGARGVGRDVTRERDRDAALARARNRERFLAYITRAIRDEADPSNILASAAETLGQALGVTVCQIFRASHEVDADTATVATELPAKVMSEPQALTFVPAARWGDLGYIAAGPVLDRVRRRRSSLEVEIGDWSILAAPTLYRQSLNGAIVLWREAGRAAWSGDDRLLIGEIANQLGIALEQMASHERILHMSRSDPLTGLYNRRAFFKELERRLQRLTRDGGPGALIYLDLDNFKAINQHKGHRAGDLVLLRLRDVLVSASRPTDVVARLGSDEFAVWLEGADIDVAKERAEQLVTAAQYLAAESPNPSVPLCLSLGVAVHRAGAGDTLEELVARADAARQGAKHTGKNAWRFADMPVVGPITGREVIP